MDVEERKPCQTWFDIDDNDNGGINDVYSSHTIHPPRL